MPPEKVADQGRPDSNRIRRVNQKMTVLSEIWQEMIFEIATGVPKSRG
jgi:hypothetical protein